MKGPTDLHPTFTFAPLNGHAVSEPIEHQDFSSLPWELSDLIDYRFPDALWIEGYKHSDGAYTFWVLDLDYSYTRWLASLSLDQRWSLSPRD